MKQMTFDLIRPRNGQVVRVLLYCLTFFITVGVVVIFAISLYNTLSKITYFITKSDFTAMAIVLASGLLITVVSKVFLSVIDKSDTIGSLTINADKIHIFRSDTHKWIQNSDIEYVRFGNAMGWSVSNPSAFKIQIVLKNEAAIDLEFVRSKSNGISLKYYAKESGIKTRYWNL